MHIALHSVTLILQTKSLRPRELYLVPKVKQVTDGRAQVQTQSAWPAVCTLLPRNYAVYMHSQGP